MTTRYFNVKQGITTGNIVLDAASSNLTGVGNLSIVNTVNANFFTGNGSSLSNITGGNVTGQVANALVAGTVYTAAQPLITSVGTLTGLTSTGVVDLTGASNVALGAVGNVHITGGTNGQVLVTNGTGGLSFVTISTASLSNGTSNIEVLNNGNISFSSAGSANVLVISSSGANVTGTLGISGNLTSGNANLGNAATANYFIGNLHGTANVALTVSDSAQPSITSVGNLTNLFVTGNTTSGNFITTGNVYAPSIVQAGTYTVKVDLSATTGIVGLTANGYTTEFLPSGQVRLDPDGTGQIFSGTSDGSQLVLGTTQTDLKQLRGGNVTVQTGASGTTSNTWTFGQDGVLTAPGNITTTANIAAGNANITSALQAGSLISNTLTAVGTADLTINSGTGNANVVLTPTGTGTVDVSNKRITQVATPSGDTDAANKGYVDSVAQGLDVKASVKAATAAALPAVTYNNGTSGVGATLTADASGALPTIDGATLAQGDRVLIKNQANQTQNGIYVVTTLGNGSTAFVLTRATDFDQGSPSGEIPAGFTFVEEGTSYADTGWVCTTNSPVTVGTTNIIFSQFSGAGQYVAGDGLTLTGTTFSVNVDTTTIQISADTLKVADSAAFVTPNIGAATGTSLSATANISANNLSATNDVGAVTGTFSGNVSVGNLSTTGGISASTIAGNLTTATQANITSLGTLSGLTVNGVSNLGPVGNVIITGGSNGYILGTNGSGNLSWVNAGSTGTAGTNTQVQFNDGGSFGATAAFTFDKSSNTLTATNIAGNGASLTSLTGANVTGNVANANLAGHVTQAIQGNITSVGTLTGLTSTGVIDLTGTSNVALGAVGNVHITGGTTGQYLRTDGAGGLSFATVDTDTLANGTSNVDISTANGNVTVGVGGVANIAIFTATGANITGTLSATSNLTVANANLGNLATANFFSGDGGQLSNITAGNITGQVANALVAGTVYTAAQPAITSVGTLTGLTVSGNVTANYVGLNNGLTTNRSNVSVTSNTVIDQFAPGTFRTAKYVVSASGDDGYQSVEALMVHDGTTAYITIYGSVCSNVSADIIDISANINGLSNNVTLYATSNSANAKVNIVASYINV